ncbi:hypothetical protein EST38_g11897 [Candolleomyces aberdarensis]|uniref:Septin-type G domain-containing protein n=1 Tax=Candolleomyces aberdarensis TaxID=2316362 RepID=A0A4Q2D3Q9_9AGAR|nr:hypothetical protein EST38_g11897 [Candolleomyces aberdarensis]
MKSGSIDIVILVVGPLGHGKSTFINHILERADAATSDGFTACTRETKSYATIIPKRQALEQEVPGNRLILVDTPGFDDSRDVSDGINWAASWLHTSKSSDVNHNVAGLVYVYPIWPNRMARNEIPSPRKLKRICGKDAASKAVLATARWDLCSQAAALERRKEELEKEFCMEKYHPGVFLEADTLQEAYKSAKDRLFRVDHLDDISLTIWQRDLTSNTSVMGIQR